MKNTGRGPNRRRTEERRPALKVTVCPSLKSTVDPEKDAPLSRSMPYQPPHDSPQYAAHQHGKGFKSLRYGTVLYDYGRSVRSLVLVRFVAGSGCVESYIMNHISHFQKPI